MKRRILSLLLCAALIIGILPISASASLPFSDVKKSDWFYSGVQYAYEHGMMDGTGNGKFSPNATTTRGMIVTILYRLEGSPSAGSAPFSDVKSGKWYTKAVAWAASKKIVDGYTNGTFRPNDPITREQLAAILYRYAKYKGRDVSARSVLWWYDDSYSISSYAEDSMSWANAHSLITGTTDTTLSPKGRATRAQAATILMRLDTHNWNEVIPALHDNDSLTISGTLTERYYEISYLSKGTVFIVKLDTPIKRRLYSSAAGYTGEIATLKEIQISLDGYSDSYIRSNLLGKHIKVTGTTMYGHTGHHLTTIVLLNARLS